MGSTLYLRLLYSLFVFSLALVNPLFARFLVPEHLVIHQTHEAIISNNVYAIELDTISDLCVLLGASNQNKMLGYNRFFQDTTREDLSSITLHQNRPNPMDESTKIGFIVPENTSATFNFYDLSGKLFYFIKGEFVKGYNQIEVDRSELPIDGPSIIYYQLVVGDRQQSKKMFLID